jgi:DUF4097 and DUF4098 domain-containing protein YvlB
MRTALALIFFGALAFATVSFKPFSSMLGGFSRDQTRITQTTQPELAGVTTLEVRTFNGEIKITRGEVAKVTITRVGNPEIWQKRTSDQYLIQAKPCPGFWNNCGVSVEVKLTADMKLRLETSNGSIDVSGKTLGVRASSSNGTITTQNTGEAVLKLDTSNGNIEIQKNQGPIEADTSNGQIGIREVSGSIAAHTSNGEVSLANVTFPSGSKNSISNSNGSLELVGFVAPAGFDIQGSTSNGSLELTLPQYQIKQDDSDFSATSLESVDQSNSGPADQKGGTLTLETSSGTITVTQ